MSHFWLLLSFLTIAGISAYHIEDELKVFNKMFHPTNTSKTIRPQLIPIWKSTPVHVDVAIDLIEFLEFNQQEETLKVILNFELFWVDNQLGWDPKDYHDIDQIQVDANMVWTPDLSLFSATKVQNWVGLGGLGFDFAILRFFFFFWSFMKKN